MNNPMLLGPTDLFTAQALTVSGGATPSLTSSPRLAVGRLSRIHVFVGNTGASTNCTISIYGAPTLTGTMTEALAVFTLGAGNETPYSVGRYIERDAVPRYIYAVITNSDAANTATITVTLDRYR